MRVLHEHGPADGQPPKRTWSVGAVRALGVQTDLETAASIFGIGRTTAYELVRAGEFPTKVLRLRHKYVVPVLPLLEVLGAAGGGEPQGQAETDGES